MDTFSVSYNTSNKRYPVLYLLDGEGHFKYVSELTDYLSGYDRNRAPENDRSWDCKC